MTDDGPRELAIDLVWDGPRLTLRVIHGDRLLHSDTVDPVSATSRTRTINKLKAKFPAIDFEELDQRLIEASTKRPHSAAGDTSGTGVALFANPEPWAIAVSGSELLDEIVSVLNRFVVLPLHGSEVVALWILHTFVFDAFEFTARLLIWSPSMRCGKSRLLRLIAALVSRALTCEGITGPALFRSIEKYRPTMLIDEADTMLRGKETSEVLRGVINAGHQRGGKVIRCTGDDSEPKVFDVFAPIAIAMIGKPPGTIEDRSIPISMRRRMPGEKVDKFQPGRSLRDQFSALVQKCVRWSADERPRLLAARPSIPSGLDDRAADCWFSLLAIADVAGGCWPELARKVAVAMMSGRESGDSIGVELLRDIKVLFDNCSDDQMSTSSLIAALVLLEERPWSDYRRGHPINARQLAALLAAFSIRSRNARLSTGVVKSYFRADFEDAWSRYLPDDGAPPPSGSATTLHAFDDSGLGQSSAATGTDDVADENRRNPLQDNGCSAVAARTGGRHEGDELLVGPAMPCRPCGSPTYWCSVTGPWVCARCHPPLDGRAAWRWDARTLTRSPWMPPPAPEMA